MESYKKAGLLLCSMMILLQSCVMNTLDDCPDAIRYSVAFRYTLHTDPDTDNRFSDDVDKMFIYVFDAATGVCVHADTTSMLAPFEPDYTYALPVTAGKYDIITCGWGRNTGDSSLRRSSAVIPAVIPGETTIDEATFMLEKTISDFKIEKTFFGDLRHVEISSFVSRVDTIDVINISNQIRVVIPDITTLEEKKNLTVRIESKNGAYSFEDDGTSTPILKPGEEKAIEYLPYAVYHTDSILRADPILGSTTYANADSMYVLEFSTLRLFAQDSETQLIFTYNGREIKFKLLELLKAGITDPDVQMHLDKYYRWQIEYKIKTTHVTVRISTIKWRVSYQPTDIGGIMQ